VSDDFLTPPALIASLGTFDLDPCAPVNRPWQIATNHLTSLENGLEQEWAGRVWLHPPLKDIDLWIAKMAAHQLGICLTFAQTHKTWFHEHVFDSAHSVFFFDGNMAFNRVTGEPYAAETYPLCLISWSQADTAAIQAANLNGHMVTL